MKRILLVAALLLSGCARTTIGSEHVRVAPNTTTCELNGKDTQCLIVSVEASGQFQSWIAVPPSVIGGFTYEPGYLYDLDVQTSCTRVGPGEFFPLLRTLKKVNSKVPSSDMITPVAQDLYSTC